MSGFPGKDQRDYFFIYTLLLYQSYSCALYSRQLMDIPAEIDKLEIRSKETLILEATKNEIDLFLVKSVFEFVCNVEHQNEYYSYVKNRLHIIENIQSITKGLKSVSDIVREKEQEVVKAKDDRLNKGLFFLGLLVAISTLTDAFNLVDWFMEKQMNVWHIIFLAVVIVFIISLIVIFVCNSVKRKK